MLSLKIKIIACLSIITAFSFCSCSKKSTPVKTTTPPPETTTPADSSNNNTTTTDSTTMKFEIVFQSTPQNASAAPAKLKYNKSNWVTMEWDDNSPGSMTAYAVVNNKYFYTDGCGNNISYSGALAVNGRNQWDNVEDGQMPGTKVTYDQMRTLINAGWDIENHSYYHEPTGNFNYGNDRDRNVKDCDSLIWYRTNYRMNGLVVPTNYSGFPTAAKNFGYLFSASEGTFDTFPPGAVPTWKEYWDFGLAPVNFSAFGRIFQDDWTNMQQDVQSAFDIMVTYNNYYTRFASHTIDSSIFVNLMNYISGKAKDKVLMISTREIMEYRIMASLPITYTLTNNKLVVTINISSVPKRFRWRDLSFIISSDAKISGVNIINGIDKATFNSSTGLVNIFKQVKQWNWN